MTQNEKNLLLKDLCGRLPYRVKIQYHKLKPPISLIGYDDSVFIGDDDWGYETENIKPYLFPMSSMTEEQKSQIEFYAFTKEYHKIVELYNENHIDYRGFIEKGLSIDATNLNIY